jgi:hypothetical protein
VKLNGEAITKIVIAKSPKKQLFDISEESVHRSRHAHNKQQEPDVVLGGEDKEEKGENGEGDDTLPGDL